MSVQTKKDLNIDFYRKNLGKVNVNTTSSEDLFSYYKGWVESIVINANVVLDKLSKEDKAYYLKHERMPKKYQNTSFGETCEKLEKLIDKMLNHDYSKNSHSDSMKFYTSCENYVNDVIEKFEKK